MGDDFVKAVKELVDDTFPYLNGGRQADLNDEVNQIRESIKRFVEWMRDSYAELNDRKLDELREHLRRIDTEMDLYQKRLDSLGRQVEDCVQMLAKQSQEHADQLAALHARLDGSGAKHDTARSTKTKFIPPPPPPPRRPLPPPEYESYDLVANDAQKTVLAHLSASKFAQHQGRLILGSSREKGVQVLLKHPSILPEHADICFRRDNRVHVRLRLATAKGTLNGRGLSTSETPVGPTDVVVFGDLPCRLLKSSRK